MNYGIDIVVDVLSKLCPPGCSPVMFQRDDKFYVATPRAFGHVGYGLFTHYAAGEPHPDMEGATNLVLSRRSNGMQGSEGVYSDAEWEVLRHLGTSYRTKGAFTLDDMMRVGRDASCDDDIRVLRGAYYFDDRAPSVAGASKIGREEYFSRMRAKEDAMREALLAREDGSIHEDFLFPDCVVVTPDFILSFPRVGHLKLQRHTPYDSWTTDRSHFVSGKSVKTSQGLRSRDQLLDYYGMEMMVENPFKIGVLFNAGEGVATEVSELPDLPRFMVAQSAYAQATSALNNFSLDGFLRKWNGAHNEAFAAEIELYEELRATERATR